MIKKILTNNSILLVLDEYKKKLLELKGELRSLSEEDVVDESKSNTSSEV